MCPELINVADFALNNDSWDNYTDCHLSWPWTSYDLETFDYWL